MVVTTLLVISLISYLLVEENKQQETGTIRADGVNFTRILANMPYRQLVPDQASSGVLQLLRGYLSNSPLAYVAVTDDSGQTVKQIARSATNVPAGLAEGGRSLWLTEHHFAEGDRQVLEFRAPVLNEGSLAGYVRAGYYLPEFQLPGETLSLLAKLALPVFLLMLFFYILVKREIRPLQDANNQVCELIAENDLANAPADTAGELQDFMQNFSHFVSVTRGRLDQLETDNANEKTSSNLLAFHKRQVESVLHTLPDAVLVIDESGQTTFANQKLESITGKSVESVIGKHARDWCDDENVSGLLSRYHGNVTPLNRKESVSYNPEAFPDKTISVSVFPLSSLEGITTLLGTLVLFRDVSREVQLVRSRDEFISHVSHELKSPLNVLRLHSELLAETTVEHGEESIESINVIDDEIERMSILINDLLKITQFEAHTITIDRQRVKMRDFLEDTFNSASRGAESKGIRTQLSISRTLSALNIDKEMFRVVLNNLLSNAIKYSDPGDTVTLEADEIDDSIQIQVSDTGIGIADEDRPRIFEKFYRSERDESRARPGHGLGLSLAREIINLHKGELSVESTVGEGTIFTIKILKTSTFLREAS